MPPRITPTFHLLKSRILSSLSSPPSTYTDASPKGSIDAGIRDLIDRINILEGVVTTSSCAGRVSVFLEGAKAVDRGEGEGEETWDDEEGGGVEAEKEGQVAVPGGKGRGGRWLFVSHEAVEVPATKQKDHFGQLFGLRGGDTTEGVAAPCANPSTTRFVRFQFEPFILHLATSSLHHAQPLLAAALTAGFRESGIQSLKNLDDAAAIPMLAVRTSGLALSSLIGVCDNNDDSGGTAKPLVSEQYLELLTKTANQRFVANRARIARFETELFKDRSGPRSSSWEDADARRERKRREGLARRDALKIECAEASD